MGKRERGTVSWFNAAKGFGMINADAGRPQVFVHFSALEPDDLYTLMEDDVVEFEVEDGPNGPQAKNVRKISGTDPVTRGEWEREIEGVGCGITREKTLRERVVEWANATFSDATTESRAEHLRREAEELASDPTDAEEMADVQMLLWHIAAGEGIDLEAAVEAKFEKNMKREWGDPDETGVVEHLTVLDEAKRYFRQQIEACRAEGLEPAYPTELLGRMILAMENEE